VSDLGEAKELGRLILNVSRGNVERVVTGSIQKGMYLVAGKDDE
jgi:hypothetical protein